MTLQPGKHVIGIHILANISRREGNQTMEFGQLIEYNMRNIFLEKSCKLFVNQVLTLQILKLSSSL